MWPNITDLQKYFQRNRPKSLKHIQFKSLSFSLHGNNLLDYTSLAPLTWRCYYFFYSSQQILAYSVCLCKAVICCDDSVCYMKEPKQRRSLFTSIYWNMNKKLPIVLRLHVWKEQSLEIHFFGPFLGSIPRLSCRGNRPKEKGLTLYFVRKRTWWYYGTK